MTAAGGDRGRVAFEPLEGLEREREIGRLAALPRSQPTRTPLLGRELEIPDGLSFVWTVPDVVERGVYLFPAEGDAPRIVDGGANVGLASLYWKSRWPACRVEAFEPDPAICGMLRRNLVAWGAGDVRVEEAALWSFAGELAFRGDGADGGRVVDRGEVATDRVAAVRLRDRLAEPVDLLKLDVEGAELELLRDCAEDLGRVRHVAVEVHSIVGRPQPFDEIVAILRRAGFRSTVEAARRETHPLFPPEPVGDLDGFVQVFARRAG